MCHFLSDFLMIIKIIVNNKTTCYLIINYTKTTTTTVFKKINVIHNYYYYNRVVLQLYHKYQHSPISQKQSMGYIRFYRLGRSFFAHSIAVTSERYTEIEIKICSYQTRQQHL